MRLLCWGAANLDSTSDIIVAFHVRLSDSERSCISVQAGHRIRDTSCVQDTWDECFVFSNCTHHHVKSIDAIKFFPIFRRDNPGTRELFYFWKRKKKSSKRIETVNSLTESVERLILRILCSAHLRNALNESRRIKTSNLKR